MKLTARTTPACVEYLHIIYNKKEYTIDAFAAEYYDGEFSLDKRLHDCQIIYRGKVYTQDAFIKRRVDFFDSLLFCERYTWEIYPKEHLFLLPNPDYYRAAKFIKRAENCLQTGRYFLCSSHDLLQNSEELHWNTGYGPIFSIRTMNCSTAAMWYNSCFDYLMLIVFFAFGLYKEMAGYSEGMANERLLKLCSYLSVGEVYSAHKKNANFKALWEIITECYNALTETSGWANFIKHKGGVDYDGLNAPPPFLMVYTDLDDKEIAKNEEFEVVLLDLDDAIARLAESHKALYKCLCELIDFLNYAGAQQKNEGGKLFFPITSEYMPDILS